MRKILLSACLAISSVAMADTPLPSSAIESIRVHQVIDAMEAAILKADVGAYMALVDPSDSFFTTEQRAWITDLQDHPVDDVEIIIAWNESITLEDEGFAIAPIEISWHVPGEELDRFFAYDALFKPIGSPDGQWVFAGRAWEIEDDQTPSVRVYADLVHEDLAYLAADRVAILRQIIAMNLGIEHNADEPEEIVVKVYPDMESLQASISLGYTDPLSGWNEPGESIKILGRAKFTQDQLDPLLAHEIGHAVSFEYGAAMNDAPWWTLEGIAEVAAGLFRDSWNSKHKRIAGMAKNDNLREWSLLADFRGEANNHARHVYLQGWSMIDYIGRTFSVDKRNQWFTALGAGGSLDEASQSVLGMTFDQLDAQWRAWLIESSEP